VRMMRQTNVFGTVGMRTIAVVLLGAAFFGSMPTPAFSAHILAGRLETNQTIDYAKAFALLRDESHENLLEAVMSRFSNSRVFPILGSYTVECGLGCGCGTHGGNHRGQDFGTQGATPPVVAVADGVVVSAGWDSGYGNLIEISHGDGVVTRYAHLDALFVSQGDSVSQGQHIGLVGSTGFAQGNHLHFEVVIDGIATNPLTQLL